MPSLALAVDRVSRIGGASNWALALAGLAGLYGGLAALDKVFAAPAPARASGEAFQVANPAGERIGTLAIDYPRRLRENEDAEIRVGYRAEEAWRARFAGAGGGARPGLKLTVQLAASRLSFRPEPATYTFDNGRILAGGNSRSWILSPEKEGDYTLLARLDVEPAGFRAVPVAANGRSLGRDGTAALPVTVHTRYSVPQATVDLGRSVAALIAFLLSLPFAASLVKRWLERDSAPAAPAVPQAAPPPPPPAGRRSGKRKQG